MNGWTALVTGRPGVGPRSRLPSSVVVFHGGLLDGLCVRRLSLGTLQWGQGNAGLNCTVSEVGRYAVSGLSVGGLSGEEELAADR